MISLVYSQDTLTWYKKTPIPSAGVMSSGYFIIDSNYYVVGGSGSNNPGNEVWKYNIIQDNWQRLRDLPYGGITELTAFTLNDKGYVCTGIDSISGYNCDTLMWEYDPASDHWSSKKAFPGVYREKANSFVYNNKAYAGLGYACGTTVTDLWEYDPITDNWSMKDSLPAIGKYGSAMATMDNNFFLIGGSDNNDSLYNDLWSYNAVSNLWDQLASIPGEARAYAVAFSFDSFFLAGYGKIIDGTYLHDLYKYDIIHNEWDTLVSLNLSGGIIENSYFTYNKQAYFFGGIINDSTFSRDMWTADASSLFHESKDTTGIATVKQDTYRFSLYPTVVSSSQRLHIQSSERGDISFYDELGQLVYTSHLDAGTTTINYDDIHRSSGILLYHATLRNGKTENGKVILY